MASIDSVFSRLNPVVSALLRSRLHWIASAGLVLITVTGRRSGRQYSFPVGYREDADRVVILVSEARHKQWWRNYRAPGRVELLLRGRRVGGEAVVVAPESEAFRSDCEDTMRRVPGLGRVFGIRYDAARGLSDEQLETLRREVAVVQVALDS
jgi:deazaflavin-dependent oxidoreductase (nitroreductase family)